MRLLHNVRVSEPRTDEHTRFGNPTRVFGSVIFGSVVPVLRFNSSDKIRLSTIRRQVFCANI